MSSGLLEVAKNSINDLKERVETQAYIILAENQKGAKNLLLENQLYLGIDGKGQRLQAYTPFTVEIKKSQGQPYDRTTLKDTGDFYQDTYLFTKAGAKFGFDSDNWKTPKLVKKYGKEIFELTPENEQFLNIEIVLPLLENWIAENLKI